MATKRLAVIASVILLTVIVNGGRPFSWPHDGSALPRHHFETAGFGTDIRSAAEQSLQAALPFPRLASFRHVTGPNLTDRGQLSSSFAAIRRTDHPVVTIPVSRFAVSANTAAHATIQRPLSSSARIVSSADDPVTSNPSDITEPVVPIAVLATLVNEDPWNGALEPGDDNPFTQVLLQTDPEPDAAANDANGNADNGADTHPDPDDPSAGDSNADTTSETSDTDAASTVESSEGNPKCVVFVRSATGQTASLFAERIDENHFELDNGTVMEIRLCGSFVDRRGDPTFLLIDDFNNDLLTDALNIQQSSGACRLFLNTGAELAPLRPFTPSSRPKFGSQLPFYEPGSRQLVLYSTENKTLEIYENWGSGQFELYASIPLAYKYDGIASSDFNGDGFGDLILQNLQYNRVSFLQNVNGQALRLLAAPPPFSSPVLMQFSPWPGRSPARFWLCDYGDQLMIYPVTSGPDRLAVLLNRLEADNCLVVGDFNQDNRLDFAIGRISF